LQSRYPLKDSWYVRMLPDHTQLLLENEAFLALPNEYRGSIDSATELLAFRNPSYFDGDLRKLKLVHYDNLLLRAYGIGNQLVAQVQGFFKSLKIGIVLSTLGDESVAEMMSGGDFDGDKAWVCFDPDLVKQVSNSPPPIRPAIPDAHSKESISAAASTLRERIKFARHFKFHQQQLGCLANTLDSAIDTVDDFTSCPAIVDIACQAFLQVDHPYQLCMPKAEAADFLRSQKQPHWSLDQALGEGEEHERAYKSKRALGRLWDYVQEKIERAVSLGSESPNVHIMQLAESAQSKLEPNLYSSTRSTMRSAAVRYKLEIKAMIEAKTSLDLIGARSQEFAEIERDRLLIEPFPEEERALAAAILYEVCGESKSFAWKVARDYLCVIVVRAQNIGNKSLPYMMDPEIDKLAFQKRRK
jgi:RNA dependent RNA polymerase